MVAEPEIMTLNGDHPACHASASWLRDHFQIPDNETIFDLYQEYFNCELQGFNPNDPWYVPDLVIFDSETDLTMFLLRWA